MDQERELLDQQVEFQKVIETKRQDQALKKLLRIGCHLGTFQKTKWTPPI